MCCLKKHSQSLWERKKKAAFPFNYNCCLSPKAQGPALQSLLGLGVGLGLESWGQPQREEAGSSRGSQASAASGPWPSCGLQEGVPESCGPVLGVWLVGGCGHG